MSAAPNSNRLSYEEYLARERTSLTKSEYYAGEIFAMVGGSRNHNSISLNISAALHNQLSDGRCRPFNSDQRIRISKLNLGTYPDVSVVCGEPEGDDIDDEAITNPKVLIEVLSKSTESYDRGKKFEFYRSIESLQEYVLVSQENACVERFVRQPNGDWLLTIYNDLEARLVLTSISIELPLSAIYRFVEFAPAEPTQDVFDPKD